ncbi:BrnA antitoxin family protein [Modicisalibacter radicis]|uniref:BrnA antitoxin family protein n=1 Tax=Halomonas sp. EAR18 TaxID=2518972 RepID=UPI00109D0CE1|nr:BrnA antitoxin family protein [Halomonas sp. EAR18]
MKTRLTDKHGEVRELTDADVKRMRPMPEVLPADLQRTIGQRGKQHAPRKVKTSIRLSREVIEHFKGEGEGWQRRIDQALKQYIREHGRG